MAAFPRGVLHKQIFVMQKIFMKSVFGVGDVLDRLNLWQRRRNLFEILNVFFLKENRNGEVHDAYPKSVG